MNPLSPTGWTCANCDRDLPPDRLLFCSEVCSEFAKHVRYYRGVFADGRIEQPDVRGWLAVRKAYVRDARVPTRPINPRLRRAAFAAKGDRCLLCGAKATVIDHIVSAYFGDDTLDNLRPLCDACHLAKTLTSSIPWEADTKEARAARLAEYERRVHAAAPLRACDDEDAWEKSWRGIVAQRQLDPLILELLTDAQQRILSGVEPETALAEAGTALGVSARQRKGIIKRFGELLAEVVASGAIDRH